MIFHFCAQSRQFIVAGHQSLIIAVQNIAARKDTAYPQLAQRLMWHVTSDTSRRRFEQLGFNWEAGDE